MSIDTFLNVMFIVFSTLLGIVIGSFTNVLIYRIPEKRTVVKGHSMCMTCGHELGALDLIPVFSWLFLGGKCRYCKAPVSSRYIKIETFTGLMFLVMSLTHTAFQLSIFDPMDPTGLIIFAHYCILLLMIPALVATMMIYNDTKKSFKGFSIYIGCLLLLMYILRLLLSVVSTFSVKSLLTNLLIGIAIAIGYVAVIALLSTVFRKKYTATDFWMDLPYALFIGLSGSLLISNTLYLIIAALVLCALPRFIIKDSKLDKLTAIFPTCGLLVVTLIGYII